MIQFTDKQHTVRRRPAIALIFWESRRGKLREPTSRIFLKDGKSATPERTLHWRSRWKRGYSRVPASGRADGKKMEGMKLGLKRSTLATLQIYVLNDQANNAAFLLDEERAEENFFLMRCLNVRVGNDSKKWKWWNGDLLLPEQGGVIAFWMLTISHCGDLRARGHSQVHLMPGHTQDSQSGPVPMCRGVVLAGWSDSAWGRAIVKEK